MLGVIESMNFATKYYASSCIQVKISKSRESLCLQPLSLSTSVAFSLSGGAIKLASLCENYLLMLSVSVHMNLSRRSC